MKPETIQEPDIRAKVDQETFGKRAPRQGAKRGRCRTPSGPAQSADGGFAAIHRCAAAPLTDRNRKNTAITTMKTMATDKQSTRIISFLYPPECGGISFFPSRLVHCQQKRPLFQGIKLQQKGARFWRATKPSTSRQRAL